MESLKNPSHSSLDCPSVLPFVTRLKSISRMTSWSSSRCTVSFSGWNHCTDGNISVHSREQSSRESATCCACLCCCSCCVRPNTHFNQLAIPNSGCWNRMNYTHSWQHAQSWQRVNWHNSSSWNKARNHIRLRRCFVWCSSRRFRFRCVQKPKNRKVKTDEFRLGPVAVVTLWFEMQSWLKNR